MNVKVIATGEVIRALEDSIELKDFVFQNENVTI